MTAGGGMRPTPEALEDLLSLAKLARQWLAAMQEDLDRLRADLGLCDE